MYVCMCAESQWDRPEGFQSQSESSAQVGEQTEVDMNSKISKQSILFQTVWPQQFTCWFSKVKLISNYFGNTLIEKQWRLVDCEINVIVPLLLVRVIGQPTSLPVSHMAVE